jgi:hypothetical protein
LFLKISLCGFFEINVTKYVEFMKLSLSTFPLLSVSSIGLAYGLLGWKLSFLSVFWAMELWFATVATIFLLIWRGDLFSRWVRWGPTVLVSILFVSMMIILAIAHTETFGVALVLVLSIFWGRLELQLWGLNQRLVLVCLSITSGSALTMGWLLGRDPRIDMVIQQSLEHFHLLEK